MKNTTSLILLLAAFTLIAFPLIGYTIHFYFEGGSIIPKLQGEIKVIWQVLIGLPLGAIAALLAIQLINSRMMLPVLKKYSNIIGDLNLNVGMVVFISICAGVGEELLFRAALQPLWGIWITSIVFVALHGYLNPMDWRMSIYGIYLTIVIIGIGFMYQYWGIWAAASAHTAVDIVLLHYLSKNSSDEIIE